MAEHAFFALIFSRKKYTQNRRTSALKHDISCITWKGLKLEATENKILKQFLE
jgi:hypothetical protein